MMDRGAQLHFELLALTKLLTELTTLAALAATVAASATEGVPSSDLTALSSASTDVFTALV
jgi:hypothetical protein